MRPPKRARLTEDAFAAIQTQSARTDVALEVDHMILDYISYQATTACLASRSDTSSSATSLSDSLSMANAFLPIFKARYPTYQADAELKFRIKLLKLVTLFTQRLTRNPATPPDSSLEALRELNQRRAFGWIQDTGEIPSSTFSGRFLEQQLPRPSQELEANRARVLRELGVPAEDRVCEEPFYGTISCVSLLDVLSLFMEVLAARNAMSASNLSERGMHLASELMLQACLEQYLIVGAEGSDVVDLAFSWGYNSSASDDKQSSSEVNDMFEDEEYAEEVKGWSAIKQSYLELLVPREGYNGSTDLASHLHPITTNYPISPFEQSILEFLQALCNSISKPVLLQLECGNLDGMTEQETQDFLAGCGVDIMNLVRHGERR